MNYFLRIILFSLFILSVNRPFACGQDKKGDSSKPNILIIMTDEQSYNMLSYMGNEYVRTPALDKLAKRGYTFGKTYVTDPVCQASRFSLQTGYYPSKVGIKENLRRKRRPRYKKYGDYIQKSYAFDPRKVERMKKKALGNVIRRAGYETYYVGKRHLYTGSSGWGYKFYTKNAYTGPVKFAKKMFPKLANDKDHKPFLAFLSFKEPHDICYLLFHNTVYVPKRLSKVLRMKKSMNRFSYLKQVPPKLTSKPIKGANPEMFAFASMHRSRIRKGWELKIKGADQKRWGLYRWVYARLVEIADQEIGHVLDALRASGLKKNTIVIFTSDHGDMQGDHGMNGKNVLLEQAQRVPFIFAGPGIKENQINNSILVMNGLDLLPTICDLIGVEPPKGLPGISLEPYLTGSGKKPERKYLISESFNSFQITDGRYKYTIFELRGHPELLIDLKKYPNENVNLANNSAYAKIKEKLKHKLMQNLARRGLTPLPTDRMMKYLTPTRIKDYSTTKALEKN